MQSFIPALCLILCSVLAPVAAEGASIEELQQRIIELERVEKEHAMLQENFRKVDQKYLKLQRQLGQTEKRLADTTLAKEREIESLMKRMRDMQVALENARKAEEKFGERAMKAEENLDEVLQMGRQQNLQLQQEAEMIFVKLEILAYLLRKNEISFKPRLFNLNGDIPGMPTELYGQQLLDSYSDIEEARELLIHVGLNPEKK